MSLGNLINAIIKGVSVESIDKIISDNALDVNLRGARGNTALIVAALYGREEVVDFLLKSDANIDLQNYYGNTPLISAAFKRHLKVVKLLLKHGAKIDPPNKDGETALHCAAGIGHANVVKELTLIDMRIVFRDTDHEVPAVAKANNVPHIDEFFSMPKDQISDAPMA
jgi:ankyrin repeat protein